MAKGKKKPASKPKAKKAEPIQKDEAIEVKKAIPEKKETPIEEVIIEEVVTEQEPEPEKEAKNAFPEKEICKHTNTKRTFGRRMRVEHVCTECGKIVKIGGR